MSRKTENRKDVLRALAAFRDRARKSGDPDAAALAGRLILQELARYCA